jgi:hypothetical protein
MFHHIISQVVIKHRQFHTVMKTDFQCKEDCAMPVSFVFQRLRAFIRSREFCGYFYCQTTAPSWSRRIHNIWGISMAVRITELMAQAFSLVNKVLCYLFSAITCLEPLSLFYYYRTLLYLIEFIHIKGDSQNK